MAVACFRHGCLCKGLLLGTLVMACAVELGVGRMYLV